MELVPIKATILSIRYRSPERDWLVATMKTEGKKETFIATGPIPYSETEEPIQLYGEWIEDAKYGKQFKATTAHRILPTTIAGLRNYLASSEEIKGIGPVRANKLATHFGSNLLGILDKNPKRLSECPGISEALASTIADSWKHDSSIRQLSLFLAKYGISPRWANKILHKWDADSAVSKIQNNPYCLTQIDGIGFITADEMAQALGMKKDAPERIEAACTHALARSVLEGNVFLHEGELITAISKLIHPRLKSTEAMVKADEESRTALAKVIERKEIIVEEISDGILTLKLLYLPYLYRAEKKLAERIAEINEYDHQIPTNLEKILANVQEQQHISFTEQQITAIRGSLRHHTVVITGGPGTGKTTCTKAICEVANKLGLNTILCAPTGRAAKRLSEVTGRTATTIHRMLKWGDSGPKHCAGNPIDAEVLVVDEASMLDLELAAYLFDAVPNSCSVIFVGDIDQLPAVGAGTTLRDIIASKSIPVIVLETVFRQAEASLIIRNSHLIKKGDMPRFPETKGVKENSYVMWIPTNGNKEIAGRDDAAWLVKHLSKIVTESIPNKFLSEGKAINPIKDIQVLVPMKKYTLGTHELNKVLQSALNPTGKEFVAGGKVFRCNDRVMQMRNNYAEGMDIYNGDIGFITSVSPEDKTIQISFYGRDVEYPFEEVGDLSLAYAQTIHKAQGSEYPIVIVIMGYQHWPMLERNLIYTANTRAKELCLFMAAKGAIEQAVKHSPVKARNTYLAQRLRLYCGEYKCQNTSQV